ncbi:hypothetical protein SAMN06297387_112180 [Streptomyces zhaozhouensis]|uniref:ABC-2 type transport system permease protein n=1 Tax=Streptomyces zhaozhouensis TaxID=1300267 RepID=A0A286DYW6_9ACTN|nr:DUF6297 family protein [Streptomyces zhaozhouensis]SOD63820.1 hypothetical protein SAMN06297387_112180 [Streptomyces zhaozhouensis]
MRLSAGRGAAPEVLVRLAGFRARGRAARRRQALYVAYCVLLLTAIYAVPYLAALVDAAAGQRWRGPTAERAREAAPAALPALAALALLGAAQLAVWRGPVRLPAAAVHWLLPHPVPRAALLLPRLRLAWLVNGVGGALSGAVAALAVHAVGGGGAAWAATLAGAGGGAAVGLMGVAAAVWTQRHHPWFGRTWLRPVLTLLAVALLAHAWSAWASSSAGWARAALWSGPWGWAALPWAATAGRVSAAEGACGGVLAALAVAGALLVARRATLALPARVLRQQTRIAGVFTAALYGADPRVARAALSAPRRTRRATGRTVRVPRARWLLVPWRDLLGLLRAPLRTGSGVALWGVTVALLAAGHPAAGVAALVTGYLAAAQLVEPARLESENHERGAALPWPRGALALRHALLPGALLLLSSAPLVAFAPLAPAWVPALLGAASVSARRGAMPASVLLGTQTPLGDTGPIQAAFWLARAPLLVLPALVPTLLSGVSTAPAVAWSLAVGAAALTWTRASASRSA